MIYLRSMSKRLIHSKKVSTREKRLYPKEKDMVEEYYRDFYSKIAKVDTSKLNLQGYTKLNK